MGKSSGVGMKGLAKALDMKRRPRARERKDWENMRVIGAKKWFGFKS